MFRARSACILATLCALLCAPLPAWASAKGDLNGDGAVDAGDVLLLEQSLQGAVSLTAAQQAAADVAPVVNGVAVGDGIVDEADLLVLGRIVSGALSVVFPPSTPVLDAVTSPTSTNPLAVTGTTSPGATVTLSVNGSVQATTSADPTTGAFQVQAILTDGTNTLSASAAANGLESQPSTPVSVDYVNNLPATFSGSITGDMVWTARGGQPYGLSGNVTVPAGTTLYVEPGALVQASGYYHLIVSGRLVVQGTATNPATFTATAATRGAWQGVLIQSSSTGTVIDNAVIEYAVVGVDVEGAVADVTSTHVLNFYTAGIRYQSGASGTVLGNTVDNTGSNQNSGTGIQVFSQAEPSLSGNTVTGTVLGISVQWAKPPVTGNTLTKNNIGVSVEVGASPSITNGNVITNNVIDGVAVEGDYVAADNPAPVVNGNTISGNGSYDYLAIAFANASRVGLDAQANYWGTPDPTQIPAKIYDRTDDPSSPLVNLLSFTNSSGVPVSGNYLSGLLGSDTTLAPGVTYLALGSIGVAAGVTLTVPSGVTVEMPHNAAILDEGTLLVQGTSASAVTLTSNAASPQSGDWQGILVGPTSTGTSINYATIEYATRGIDVAGTTADVTNSTFSGFPSAGYAIYYHDSSAGIAAGGTISGNHVDNGNQQGTGIYIANSAPTVSGNQIQNTASGIYLYGHAAPAINGNNVITGNAIGIELQGTGTSGESPTPSIENNQIYGNVSANLQVSQFTATDAETPVDARQNWWGSAQVASIQATIKSIGDLLIPVDFSGFLDASDGQPTAGVYLTTLLTNITRSRDTLNPVAGQSVNIGFWTLEPSTTVTLTICDDTDATCASPVRQITQTFASAGSQTLAWDGHTDQGGFAPDEAYAYQLEATDASQSSGYSTPPGSGGSGSTFHTAASPPVDFFRNEDWILQITVGYHPGRIGVQITPAGGNLFYIFQNVPYALGDHVILWDGRDPTGKIVGGNFTYQVTAPAAIHSNAVIVEGTAPSITGTGTSPNIEVKSNPYLVYQTYEQISHIVYRLDQDSYVTVKLLPPNVSDPASPQAIVLVNNQLESAQSNGTPIDHTVEWTGYSGSDTHQLLTADEGVFTFTIQAQSVATGFSSLYRGVLQIHQ